MMTFALKMMTFCIHNDEFCIHNDEFSIRRTNERVLWRRGLGPFGEAAGEYFIELKKEDSSMENEDSSIENDDSCIEK